MKIYSNKTVQEAALERIRFLFDEFPNVVIGFSGGKDSTTVLYLSLKVAEEKNRLPLPVLFIDQEAEWQGTIDYVASVYENPKIKALWYQMPMVITNNASSYNRYAKCWDEDEKDNWVHPQNPISIKENKYGTERFHKLFDAIFKVDFKGQKACYLAGVRTEETPKRFVGLTGDATYKYITWAKRLNTGREKDHYTFYPIYDWSYTDVWKFINDNDLPYNRIYDELYRHGATLNDMRISNLHHETSIQSLLLVQKIEPNTWNRVVERIDGASALKHIKKNSFVCPKELPAMFNDWEEYALYLADNIIQSDKHRKALQRIIDGAEKYYFKDEPIKTRFWNVIINTILSSDFDFTKYVNWKMSGSVDTYRRYHCNPGGVMTEKFNWLPNMMKSTKYLYTNEIKELINYFKNGKHKKLNK